MGRFHSNLAKHAFNICDQSKSLAKNEPKHLTSCLPNQDLALAHYLTTALHTWQRNRTPPVFYQAYMGAAQGNGEDTKQEGPH